MTRQQKHFDLWLSFLAYCEGEREYKMVRAKVDELARSYKQMDYVEQGDFHQLVHEWQPKAL